MALQQPNSTRGDMYAFASLIVPEHTQESLDTVSGTCIFQCHAVANSILKCHRCVLLPVCGEWGHESNPRHFKKKATIKCKCKAVHLERNECQNKQKGPQPCVCVTFHQSFLTVSFHDTFAGFYGSVSERVLMKMLGCLFSGFCFPVRSMLVLIFFNLP